MGAPSPETGSARPSNVGRASRSKAWPGGRGRAQRGEEQGDGPSPVAAGMREARHREHRVRGRHGGPRQLEGHERSPCAGPRGSGNGGQRGFLPTASLDTERRQGGGDGGAGGGFLGYQKGHRFECPSRSVSVPMLRVCSLGTGFGRAGARITPLETAHPEDLPPRTRLLDLAAALLFRTGLAPTPAARGPQLSSCPLRTPCVQDCSVLSSCLA